MSDTSPSDNAPLRGRRILVVDDEFLILLDIQNILEAAGAELILTASRLDEALHALDGGKPPGGFDAAVLDLKLEKDSSVPIAEKLTADFVPFVFLTGAPTEVSLARKFGSAPVIGKPFDGATLLAALEQAIARRR